MFKVNNKDVRATPMVFTPWSSVSIVNFEQVNVGWELILSLVGERTILLSTTLLFFISDQ